MSNRICALMGPAISGPQAAAEAASLSCVLADDLVSTSVSIWPTRLALQRLETGPWDGCGVRGGLVGGAARALPSCGPLTPPPRRGG
jgi:hypothetical protein